MVLSYTTLNFAHSVNPYRKIDNPLKADLTRYGVRLAAVFTPRETGRHPNDFVQSRRLLRRELAQAMLKAIQPVGGEVNLQGYLRIWMGFALVRYTLQC